MVRSGGYIEVKPQYFEQIPIPEIKDEESFNKVVSSVISLVDELQSLDKKFQSYFSSSSLIQKLSKKLQNWHELEFADFIKELNKAIKKEGGTALTKKDEFEWLDLFEENKTKAQELQAKINQTEQKIDQMVCTLYALTEDEIAIVENA